MPNINYLFEIHVYRLTENDYYDATQKYIDKTNSNLQYPMDVDFLLKQYGGSWQYNEIIGFLKFYQYGANQIRCEYWETDSSRKVKTRKKQFVKNLTVIAGSHFQKVIVMLRWLILAKCG